MRKLIEQLTRKPRAAPVLKNVVGRDKAVREARARLARVRDDLRDTREGFMRGELDIADLAQE